jgi:hypothetical protein
MIAAKAVARGAVESRQNESIATGGTMIGGAFAPAHALSRSAAHKRLTYGK